MTGKDLIFGMNYLEDALIQEAEEKSLPKGIFPSAKWLGTAAACLGLALTAALWANRPAIPSDYHNIDSMEYVQLTQMPSIPSGQDMPDSFVQDTPGSSAAAPSIAASQDPAGSFVQDTPGSSAAAPSAAPSQSQPDSLEQESLPASLDLAKITVNDFTDLLSSDAARLYYDPALYDEIIWNKEDVISYYGKDLIPAYIPEGLTASPGNGTARVVLKKDGTVAEDTVYLNFWHDRDEDNLPYYNAAGISLTASKLGILNCCIYVFSEDMKPSEISGVSVMIGYRSMSYGPYDPVTHEPSGYYDLYEADFSYDGIEYQIIATRIEPEELVKVAASIITGKEDFEIVNEIP